MKGVIKEEGGYAVRGIDGGGGEIVSDFRSEGGGE